ncbi:hypothetical protein F3Y22_tig00111394pilonHSYRG00022 [Hibiscus syriacus]|uniref:Uncharacterized protein n=1 Tax=Hibiscus syriacus TaxID=106335 RepID=A0A6A2XVQ3_HIBSY|nr:hypothetical protein F3Y22_tig00111394pilonHSYRG00022 [Hibiscus syriacus]
MNPPLKMMKSVMMLPAYSHKRHFHLQVAMLLTCLSQQQVLNPRGEANRILIWHHHLQSQYSEERKAHVKASSVSGSANAQPVEREEGEWSDAEGSADAHGNSNIHEDIKASQEQCVQEVMETSASEGNASGVTVDTVSAAEKSHTPLRLEQILSDQKGNISRNSEGNAKGDISVDRQEEPGLLPKQREVKGIEASYALKCANNPGKRKIDEQKEAMLGKKRNRKTMFFGGC